MAVPEMLEIVDILDDEQAMLIPESNEVRHKVINIPVNQIVVPEVAGGDPVTKEFIDSIATGMIYPIRVRESDDGYVLLDGWRRLQAAKALSRKSIAAEVENRDLSELQGVVLGLVTNFGRSENFIGSARRVWFALDQGVTEKELAAVPGGPKLAKIRQLRDMRNLRPELIAACEAGNMSAWSAWMAGRDTVDQDELIAILEENGKITKADVENARRVEEGKAAASLPGSMFDVPGIEMDDEAAEYYGEERDGHPDGLASQDDENGPQSDGEYEKVLQSVSDEKGKVSRKGRYQLVSARVKEAMREMVKIKAPRKEDEQDILERMAAILEELAEMSAEG